MLSIPHQKHPQRSHKLRANLFQEEKELFENTKIRRLSHLMRKTPDFFVKENILSQSISDKEDKHLEIQN